MLSPALCFFNDGNGGRVGFTVAVAVSVLQSVLAVVDAVSDVNVINLGCWYRRCCLCPLLPWLSLLWTRVFCVAAGAVVG